MRLQQGARAGSHSAGQSEQALLEPEHRSALNPDSRWCRLHPCLQSVCVDRRADAASGGGDVLRPAGAGHAHARGLPAHAESGTGRPGSSSGSGGASALTDGTRLFLREASMRVSERDWGLG